MPLGVFMYIWTGNKRVKFHVKIPSGWLENGKKLYGKLFFAAHCRSSAVTVSLTVTVLPQIAMQVLTWHPHFWGRSDFRGSVRWYIEPNVHAKFHPHKLSSFLQLWCHWHCPLLDSILSPWQNLVCMHWWTLISCNLMLCGCASRLCPWATTLLYLHLTFVNNTSSIQCFQQQHADDTQLCHSLPPITVIALQHSSHVYPHFMLGFMKTAWHLINQIRRHSLWQISKAQICVWPYFRSSSRFRHALIRQREDPQDYTWFQSYQGASY